ncbi:MAG TPA: hypothetical protein PLI09_04820 [Candidatus Hydrogenedentes bacterium]|nr:hypothetical protein [Candidatus Hydrogenedentota bacterium]
MTQLILKDIPPELAEAITEVAAGEDRVIIEYQGKRVAAVSLDLLEWIEEIEDQIDREEIRKAREEMAQEGTIPWEQVKAELNL